MNMEMLQIVPAGRWEAAFDDGKGTRIPLAFWALIKNPDGSTAVKGMIPASWRQMRCCEEFDEFLCYVQEGAPLGGAR